MANISDTAIVLAAGRGERLRPLTLTTPKPLLEVGGRTMLDQAIDRLKEIGIHRVVVNCHHLADKIEAHLATRTDVTIIISREDVLLETGGGVKNALPAFGDKPFFVINSDFPMRDTGETSLESLTKAWNPALMDMLLLMQETHLTRGCSSHGDFMMRPDGKLWRKGTQPPRPYTFVSEFLVKPELYHLVTDKVFSNNVIFDIAEERGRLYGALYHGTSYQATSPEDLAEANRLLATGEGWGFPEKKKEAASL